MKQEINNEKLEGIIRKVKGLLALAEDNKNEDEAQSAFTMAQKLMIKYNIEISQVQELTKENVNKREVTAYKTLHWYERILADIIAQNFRVKHYYNSKRATGETRIKRTIIFYGLDHDIKMAHEMYILAGDALDFYSKQYVELKYSTNCFLTRNRTTTTEIKNAYMKGFLYGLKERMKQQKQELEQEYGLVVLMPVVVTEAYNELSKGFGKALALNTPSVSGDNESYRKGYEDGKSIDYSKSTIDVE